MEKDLNVDYNISNDYLSKEFPLGYNRLMIGDALIQESFANECLQKIFHSGRISGTRLLDFGCGPTIHKVASASRQFNDIILAEWSEANRNAVEKWLRGDKDALDWTPLLEQCVRAEGYRDLEKGVAEVEERIRKAVKKVVPCDILSKEILPEGIGEFDVINSSYCLESCCFTIKLFKEGVTKLTKYLKRSGALVMSTVLESISYDTYKTIPTFQVNEKIIKEALNEAGLELKDWFYWRDTLEHELYKYGGLVICYAIKI